MELRAPIVAVTVYPGQARVSRRGRVTVPAGASELVVADLPETLLDESVRVAGRGGGVRIVGVDVRRRDLAEVPDERVRAAEEALRSAERAVAAVDAEDAGAAARQELLARLATRGGGRLARALAEGAAEFGRIAELGSAVADQVAQVVAARGANAERRAEAQRAVDAARAELDRLRASGRSRREVAVAVEADDSVGGWNPTEEAGRVGGELEIDLDYVVTAAGWSTAYDARLTDAGTLELTWYGMVTQASGEDWPAGELTLSTARPARTATVPELDPWWVDVLRPPAPAAPRMRAASMDTMAVAGSAPVLEAQRLPESPDAVAASWRLPRPVAVPGDGTPHRTTVTTLALPARLDHVTAPAVGLDVHLRATVTNTGGQALLGGPVATFVDGAFVGTTVIEPTAPDAELELALGVDERVVVERELAERTVHKARFGAGRGAIERWTITVTNRRPAKATVTVRDRVPVTRNADIKIVDVALKPEPAEQDELGRVEWVATVAPGATWEASVAFGVEHPKDLPVTGWR